MSNKFGKCPECGKRHDPKLHGKPDIRDFAKEMAEMLLETYQRGCFRASPNEVEALLNKAGVL